MVNKKQPPYSYIVCRKFYNTKGAKKMKRREIVLGLICVLLMSGCTKNMTVNPVGGNVSDTSEVPSATVTDLGVSNSIEKPLTETEEQIVDVSELQEPASKVSQQDANTLDTSTDKAIKVVWSNIYYWAMGSDYVYIDSDGYIYAEHEMEEPLFSPLGACDETYTGKKFTEEEFNAFLELKYDDEVAQKEVLSKKGIKFGK